MISWLIQKISRGAIGKSDAVGRSNLSIEITSGSSRSYSWWKYISDIYIIWYNMYILYTRHIYIYRHSKHNLEAWVSILVLKSCIFLFVSVSLDIGYCTPKLRNKLPMNIAINFMPITHIEHTQISKSPVWWILEVKKQCQRVKPTCSQLLMVELVEPTFFQLKTTPLCPASGNWLSHLAGKDWFSLRDHRTWSKKCPLWSSKLVNQPQTDMNSRLLFSGRPHFSTFDVKEQDGLLRFTTKMNHMRSYDLQNWGSMFENTTGHHGSPLLRLT